MNIEQLYRHQYGLLVANLTNRFGIEAIEIIEDAVQHAIEQALKRWTKNTNPENKTGWLYKVAYRFVLQILNSENRQRELLKKSPIQNISEPSTDNHFLKGELNDQFLKMLFICCDNKIPVESQLVFTLKSLCGFNMDGLAMRLFISEANAYKRFQRAKLVLKAQFLDFEHYSEKELTSRLPSVLNVLYVMFTEGYLSSHPEQSIRKELCEEAIRILSLLINNKIGESAECHALIALMYFNLARINARVGDSGLVLLEQQDRRNWNEGNIKTAMMYLELSTNSENITRYHIEAGIAAEHCMSPSFSDTNWQNIIDSYELLEKILPSPMHMLSKAIAIAEFKGPQQALTTLMQQNAPSWLLRSYYWYAVVADLQFRSANHEEAASSANSAIQLASSPHIALLLKRRFSKYHFDTD